MNIAGAGAADQFGIGWDIRDRARLHELWDEVLSSGRWSEGPMTSRFESAWSEWNEAGAVATASWTGAAMAALTFARVRGETVLCPSNTFMATPLAAVNAGANGRVRRLQPRRPVRVVRRLRARGREAQAAGGVRRPHRRPHRVRDRQDRRLLPRERHLPDRGLRARARRRLERPPAGHVGRRRAVVVLRDQDRLHRRGRDARVGQRRAARVRAQVPQLRQARARGRRPELPPQRVHRRDRRRADRADAGDRRLEERGRAGASSTARIRAGSSSPTG